MTAAAVLSFPETYVNDTSYFCRALDHYRFATGCSVPFHELAPEQRSKVLAISQAFKIGLDVCEFEEQWGRGDKVNGVDCSALGTICDLRKEKLVCEKHFYVGHEPMDEYERRSR